MITKNWLQEATVHLASAGITTARLDAEIILSHTLRVGRTYLHAHNELLLSDRQKEIADARLALRHDHTPIAYIIGHKEFYGRPFRVTPSTLIPRPESEEMITLLKDLLSKNLLFPMAQTLVDVGTGCGCLGITAKLEIPDLNVSLIDISKHALNVAESNVKQLHVDVTLLQSDLLASYPFQAVDIILANLPYVDTSWDRSPETNYEPEIALFASDNGLRTIKKIIKQAPTYLATGGLLLLEADIRQHKAIKQMARENHFIIKEVRGLILCLQRE